MRRTWHMVVKELLQNLRDPLALVFTIIMPLVFTVFLGFLIPGGDDEESALPLAIADLDKSPAATQLIEALDETPLLEVEAMDVADIDAAVQDQDVTAGIVIPQGYGEAMEAGRAIALGFVRLQTSTGAQSAWQAIEAVLSESNVIALAAGAAAEQVATATGGSPDDSLIDSARPVVQAELAAPAATVATKSSGTSVAAQTGGFEQSSKGSIVYWVFFGVMSVGGTMVLERQRGLLRRPHDCSVAEEFDL